MVEHNDIINAGIANFTSIMVNLTDEADSFGGHLELVQKLVNMSTGNLGGSFESWGEAVQILADANEAIKTGTASGTDKKEMLKLINDTTETMAAEMKDMEVFMKVLDLAVATLLKTLDAYPNPQGAVEAKGVNQQESDLQWSWDEITAEGTVVRSVGAFTEIQKGLITGMSLILPSPHNSSSLLDFDGARDS